MRKLFEHFKSLLFLSAFLLFSVIIKAQSISTDPISGSPFCACSNTSVSFTSIGLFNPGNIFTVQLSDATGNFATPVIIGALVSVENKDTIACTLPCSASSGTGYRIRVISSDTSLIGTNNGTDLTINASVISSVDIYADSIVCPGDPVLFTVKSIINGGTQPTYQWKVNGVNVGTDTSEYLADSLNNGDKVWVVITADTLCPRPAFLSSDTIVMVVQDPIPALVFIFTHDTIVCAGDPVGFMAIPIGGGATPSFQWVLNGTNVGTNSPFYIADSLQQNDEVYVIMTSSSSCAMPIPATSNKLTIDVVTSITPTVSISASATTICSGDLVTFSTSPTGGGLGASYQWKVNGVNVGIDSSEFTSYTLKNGDVVSVLMTSSMSCASPITATSNSITMNVTTSVTALVSVSVNLTGAVCVGQSVTFTATPTNGGTTPTYQWQLNGSNVGTNSTSYTTVPLNGDIITVIMTSNATCALNSPVTSNPITMKVSSSIAPSVSIWPGPTVTICPGALAGFIATPTGGGLTPMYQWQVNGVNSGAPTTSRVFTSTTLNNGDIVKVILTSDLPCATPTTASDSVTIISSSSLAITVNSATICPGQTATLTASGGTTYLWSSGATTTYITVSPSTTTSYTVTGTTSSCSGSAVATVTVSAVGALTATSATICSGGSATLTASGANTYSWSTGATTSSITVNPTSNTSYTVTGTSGSCTATALATVTINSSLTITVNSPSICAGETATLIANNGTLYSWSPGGQTTNSITVAPAVTTSYTVAGTSGTCSDSAVSVVTIVTILPVTATSAAVCPGQTATLTASGAVTYSWSPGGQTSASIIVTSTPASYIVTGYSSSGGCTGTAIATVTTASATPVTISGNLVINACEETTLTAFPGGNTYFWGPTPCDGCQSITVTPPASQQYYVNYTDANGCSDGDTVTVVVTTLNTYFLPTALSPNGDGINDEIHFHGRGIESFTLKIFDRIGEKVFETSDMERGWNGKLLGVAMNDAVFVYTLNITFCNGEEVRTKGAITLVK
ncbi:MAG: gliding motility-associated C-terminal domain-containing protein [Bacteroidota bacterium]